MCFFGLQCGFCECNAQCAKAHARCAEAHALCPFSKSSHCNVKVACSVCKSACALPHFGISGHLGRLSGHLAIFEILIPNCSLVGRGGGLSWTDAGNLGIHDTSTHPLGGRERKISGTSRRDKGGKAATGLTARSVGRIKTRIIRTGCLLSQ